MDFAHPYRENSARAMCTARIKYIQLIIFISVSCAFDFRSGAYTPTLCMVRPLAVFISSVPAAGNMWVLQLAEAFNS